MGKPKVSTTSRVFLGHGDSVNITVWQEDDLTLEDVVVDDRGMIRMPLIGDVVASGRGLPQVRAEIETRLAEYIKNPQVLITMESTASQKAMILGEVTSPGVITLDHDVTLFEAVTTCGGFSDDANTDNVMLFREENGEHKFYVVNANSRSKTGLPQHVALYLQAGDIVYVPTLTIAEVQAFMTRIQDILRPLVSLSELVIYIPQVRDAVKNIAKGKADTESSSSVTPNTSLTNSSNSTSD